MSTTIVAFNILIFLLPGFVIQRMIEALTVSPKRSDPSKIIDALSFSLINYVIYSFISLPLGLQSTPLKLNNTGSIVFTKIVDIVDNRLCLLKNYQYRLSL